MGALAPPRAAVLDLEAAAADHVIAALRRLRCTVARRNAFSCDYPSIEAWKGHEHLLMCLRAALAPSEPTDLTEEEARAFRREAARADAEPWVAHIVLDSDLELTRLDWWPLEGPNEAPMEGGVEMDDERLPEKIEIVRKLLSAAAGGKTVDYLSPHETGRDYLHLFRVGRRPSDHRLWLGQDLLEDLPVDGLAVWLRDRRVPELFAANTAKQVACQSVLEAPRLIDRDDWGITRELGWQQAR